MEYSAKKCLSVWKVIVFYIFLWGSLSYSIISGQEHTQDSFGFIADRCYEEDRDEEHFVPETFQLPGKVFGLQNYSASLTIENTRNNSCNWRVTINVNLTTEENITEQSVLFNGIDKLKVNGYVFSREDFCISNISDQNISINICRPKCTDDSLCVLVCCEGSQVPDVKEAQSPSCLRQDNEYTSDALYSQDFKEPDLNHGIFATTIDNDLTYTCVYSLSVPNFLPNISYVGEKEHLVTKDGSVFYKLNRNSWKYMSDGYYCTRQAVSSHNYRNEASSNYTSILVCAKPWNFDNPWLNVWFGLRYGTWTTFHAVTCLVYCVLADKEPVYRWTIVALMGSTAVASATFGLQHFAPLFLDPNRLDEYFTVCTALGIIFHFFALSAYSWLTVANFDVCLALRFLKPGRGSKRRLWFYAGFAVLFPGTLVGTGAVIHFVYLNHSENQLTSTQCGAYLDGDVRILMALYFAPTATLLLLNVCLFVTTGISVCKAKKKTTIARRTSTQSNSPKDSFLLFLRLFLVMGIPTICGWISWFLKPSDWATYLLKIIDYLQAPLVFWVLVLKKDVRKSLVNKWPWVDRIWCICRCKDPLNSFHCCNKSVVHTPETTLPSIKQYSEEILTT